MGFIYCPECGSKISDQARQCPHCGFSNKGDLIPISKMEYSITPKKIIIPSIDVFGNGTNFLSVEDNNILYSFLSNVENLSKYAPGIYDLIKKRAGGEVALVADISEKVKKLIDEGQLALNIDKETGELLPTLRNLKTGKIYKQVRLKEQFFPADVSATVMNLQQQAMMKSILDEIKYLSQSIEEIQAEMMDDRLAEAEAAWYELEQATQIQDTQLRNFKVLSLQSEATRTRLKLEKNFHRNMLNINKDKLKAKDKSKYSERALNELSVISMMARIEYVSYYMLGEQKAGIHALEQYQSFIEMNHLNNRDTLIKINEYTKIDSQNVIKEFLTISNALEQVQLKIKEQKVELIENAGKR